LRGVKVKGFGRASKYRAVVIIAMLLTAIFCLGVYKIKTGAGLPRLATTAGTSGDESGDGTYSAAGSSKTVGQSNGWQTVKMRVTAYCACRKCCGKFSDGHTACGHRIRPGDAFAAADKKYAFGTELIIPGYNRTRPVKILDRGRLIRGNRLDVFFSNHKKARKWGVKYLDVKLRQG
jgi:3D (Asp-Asp-Asp) domain-containing protein